MKKIHTRNQVTCFIDSCCIFFHVKSEMELSGNKFDPDQDSKDVVSGRVKTVELNR